MEGRVGLNWGVHGDLAEMVKDRQQHSPEHVGKLGKVDAAVVVQIVVVEQFMALTKRWSVQPK